MKHCLTLLLLLLAITATAQTKAPKLVLETSEHNLGRIKEGSKVSHTFTLKNEGTADLLIESVSTSCGCTTSAFDQVIPAGKAGKVTLIVTPGEVGTYTRYATVYTNDPQRAEFQLALKYESFIPKGYRVGSYLFDPKTEIEATLAPGKIYEGKVGIYFSSDRVVEIKKTEADNPAFTVALDTITPGREFKLNVKSADQLPAGAHKLLVKLLTDDPNQDVLEIAFLVKVGNAPAEGAAVKPAAPAKANEKKAPVKTKRN